MIQPPRIGPAIGATTAIMEISASAIARLAGGKIAIINDCVTGYIGPATKPCMARNTINVPMFCAIPQRNDITVNAMVAAMNSRTSPNRRDIQPVSGNEMAMLTENAVITQVPCCALAPRFPAMVGTATLAIVESSTCMKIAIVNPTVVRGRLRGLKTAFVKAFSSRQP